MDYPALSVMGWVAQKPQKIDFKMDENQNNIIILASISLPFQKKGSKKGSKRGQVLACIFQMVVYTLRHEQAIKNRESG